MIMPYLFLLRSQVPIKRIGNGGGPKRRSHWPVYITTDVRHIGNGKLFLLRILSGKNERRPAVVIMPGDIQFGKRRITHEITFIAARIRKEFLTIERPSIASFIIMFYIQLAPKTTFIPRNLLR